MGGVRFLQKTPESDSADRLPRKLCNLLCLERQGQGCLSKDVVFFSWQYCFCCSRSCFCYYRHDLIDASHLATTSKRQQNLRRAVTVEVSQDRRAGRELHLALCGLYILGHHSCRSIFYIALSVLSWAKTMAIPKIRKTYLVSSLVSSWGTALEKTYVHI